MKYIINWSERKRTTTGKEKLSASLKGEDGAITEDATIWQDFPGFQELMTGHTVEGDLVPAKDPKYGPTLYPLKKTTAWGMSKPYLKSGAVSALMDKKAEQIEKAQDRKAESIAYFNSVNSAIALTQHVTSPLNIEEKKAELIYWRDWFLSEYDKWNSKPPF